MTSTRLSTYAPNQVTIVVSQDDWTHVVSQYSEDSIVTIERNAETFTLYTGADDTSTRIFNANSSGNITIALQQTSASNDVFNAIYERDRGTRNGLFNITVRDNSGRSEYYAEEAYIGVIPNSAFANSMQTREWVIHAPRLDHVIGGNSLVSDEDKATLNALGVDVGPRW